MPRASYSFLIAVIGVLVTTSHGTAQLSGIVVDRETGTPIAAARATLTSRSPSRTTDQEGVFDFSSAEFALPDTLLVEAEGYEPGRIVLGSALASPRLVVSLRATPTFRPRNEEHRALRSRATRFAEDTGGHLWTAEEFLPYQRSVANATDLLVYSGLVERVSESGSGAMCITIRAALGCAEIEFEGPSRGRDSLREWLPSEIDSFVIVAGPVLSEFRGRPSASGQIYVFPWR